LEETAVNHVPTILKIVIDRLENLFYNQCRFAHPTRFFSHLLNSTWATTRYSCHPDSTNPFLSKGPCDMANPPIWPKGVAKPAQRALASVGFFELTQLTKISEAELLKLHGMGPKAIRYLREALAEQGLAFKKDNYVNEYR
jgi:hypothetical protein